MVKSSPRGSPSEEKHKIRLFLESLSGFQSVTESGTELTLF